MRTRRSSFMRRTITQRRSFRGRMKGVRMGRNRCRRRMAHPVPIDASYGVTAAVTACHAAACVAAKGMGTNASAGKAVTTTASAAAVAAAVVATAAASTAPGVATTTAATATAPTGRPGAGQRRRG
jgi:hypothetical protein